MNVSSVVKIGGSLLDLPSLPARLEELLADFGRPRTVATCGGGRLVEEVRRLDRIHNLGDEASHWIALRALGVSAAMLERVVEALVCSSSPEEWPGIWRGGKTPLYDAHTFLRQIDEQRTDPLPRRWRVTSDSIAARMATHFHAPELVLLKSITPAAEMTIAEATRQGIVDPHFPTAAQGIARVVVINPRDERLDEIELR